LRGHLVAEIRFDLGRDSGSLVTPRVTLLSAHLAHASEARPAQIWYSRARLPSVERPRGRNPCGFGIGLSECSQVRELSPSPLSRPPGLCESDPEQYRRVGRRNRGVRRHEQRHQERDHPAGRHQPKSEESAARAAWPAWAARNPGDNRGSESGDPHSARRRSRRLSDLSRPTAANRGRLPGARNWNAGICSDGHAKQTHCEGMGRKGSEFGHSSGSANRLRLLRAERDSSSMRPAMLV
jgi:hypothetical protein